VLYYDLAQEDIFSGSGDPQFQVYRDMRDSVGDHWHTFCPYTNVLVRRYMSHDRCLSRHR
jgi:serine/threonine-protein kinase haspin